MSVDWKRLWLVEMDVCVGVYRKYLYLIIYYS
jgi:hypothetical protein